MIIDNKIGTYMNCTFLDVIWFIKQNFPLIGGSEGLFAQKTLEITDDILQSYKNQGEDEQE